MTFIETLLLTLFTSGIVGSVVSYVLYRKKNNAETDMTTSETAAKQVATAMVLVEGYTKGHEELLKSYEEMMNKMTQMKEDNEISVNELTGKIDEITKEFSLSMERLRIENEELKQDNIDLQERVKRLEAQVVSLGGHPVTMNKRQEDSKK